MPKADAEEEVEEIEVDEEGQGTNDLTFLPQMY